MYKGKHASETKLPKKTIILLAAFLLIFTVTAGSTLAYLVVSTPSVENIFLPTSLSGEVKEDPFDKVTKKDVYVDVQGDVDAYVRAAIVVTWKNSTTGAVHITKPVEGTDYTIEYGTGWTEKKADGFYYYTSKVNAGGQTTNLIDTCVVNEAAPAEGYTLSVEILTQGIQAEPAQAVVDAWGATAAGYVGVSAN